MEPWDTRGLLVDTVLIRVLERELNLSYRWEAPTSIGGEGCHVRPKYLRPWNVFCGLFCWGEFGEWSFLGE